MCGHVICAAGEDKKINLEEFSTLFSSIMGVQVRGHGGCAGEGMGAGR